MSYKPNQYYQLVPATQTTDIITGVVKAIMPYLDKRPPLPKDDEEELLTVEETLKF